MAKRAEVFGFLDERGIAYRLQEHAAVYTVAESSKVLNEKVSVKTLLLREEKGTRLFMVAMRGDIRLDTKNLAHNLGVKKLQFVKTEQVEDLVGSPADVETIVTATGHAYTKVML